MSSADSAPDEDTERDTQPDQSDDPDADWERMQDEGTFPHWL